MDRLKSGRAPFMLDHGIADGMLGGGPSTRDVIGVITAAGFEGAGENRQGWADVRLSSREALNDLVLDMAAGILPNASLGYKVYKYRDVTPPRESETAPEPTKVLRAVDWEGFEISLVFSGAEIGAMVRSEPSTHLCSVVSMRSETDNPLLFDQEGQQMSWEERVRTMVRSAGLSDGFAEDLIRRFPEESGEQGVKTAIEAEQTRSSTPPPAPEPQPAPAPPAAPTPPVDVETVRDQIRTEEVARLTAIRTAGTRGGLEATQIEELERNRDVTAENVGNRVLEVMATRSAATPTSPHVSVTREEDSPLETARIAFDHRMQNVKDDVFERHPKARRFRRMSLLQLGETLLEARGIDTSMMGKDALAMRILGMQGQSDFPELARDAANKRLRKAYTIYPSQWKLFADRVDAPDFKTVRSIQMGEVPSLGATNAHGEFPHAQLTDTAETYALQTSGVVISFTRQMIINDDLSAFSRLPKQMGEAAARLEADEVFAILTANALLSDGVALFAAGHGNIDTQALDMPAMSTMRQLMRDQTGIAGVEHLNVIPAYLIVPSSLETTALELLATVSRVTFYESGEPSVNTFAGTMTPIIEPRLETDSSIKWYAAAAPSQMPGIEYAYLEGEDGPDIATEEQITVDGLLMRVRHDFRAAPVEFRALFHSDGTT
jgi:hypothetical protein